MNNNDILHWSLVLYNTIYHHWTSLAFQASFSVPHFVGNIYIHKTVFPVIFCQFTYVLRRICMLLFARICQALHFHLLEKSLLLINCWSKAQFHKRTWYKKHNAIHTWEVKTLQPSNLRFRVTQIQQRWHRYNITKCTSLFYVIIYLFFHKWNSIFSLFWAKGWYTHYDLSVLHTTY